MASKWRREKNSSGNEHPTFFSPGSAQVSAALSGKAQALLINYQEKSFMRFESEPNKQRRVSGDEKIPRTKSSPIEIGVRTAVAEVGLKNLLF